MIRKNSTSKRFFLVCCSDWQTVTLSKDYLEAAEQGFINAFEKYGENLNLSNIISVTDIQNTVDMEVEDIEILTLQDVIRGCAENSELYSERLYQIAKNLTFLLEFT
jgi:hypothetical protein